MPYLFNTPEDRIIWDVGHQAYAHKLITGRRDRFHTLRRHEGLSGFTRTTESPYDAFSTGHSSTSISAGLGIACGKSLKDDPSKVIAVIGDGSLTAGLAFEGLNQAGSHNDKELIVILNDNKMSISPNVGAISKYLTRITSGKHYVRLEADIWDLLGKIPHGSKAQALASTIDGIMGGDVPAQKYVAGAILGGILSTVMGGLGITVGLGFYLPFNIVLTYSLGTLARELADRLQGQTWSEQVGIPIAAGLIVGEALVGVGHAIDIVLEDEPELRADEGFIYDVAAYVLNRIPPRYLMSERGFLRHAVEHDRLGSV